MTTFVSIQHCKPPMRKCVLTRIDDNGLVYFRFGVRLRSGWRWTIDSAGFEDTSEQPSRGQVTHWADPASLEFLRGQECYAASLV